MREKERERERRKDLNILLFLLKSERDGPTHTRINKCGVMGTLLHKINEELIDIFYLLILSLYFSCVTLARLHNAITRLIVA